MSTITENGSTSVGLRGIRKVFGELVAISDMSLTIEAGEFVTFLGPSGCGKTTTLRMIAGLLSQDGGEIHFGDRRVDQLPSNRRNVGLVFQNYALFPHMTVSENIAFGLRMRHWKRPAVLSRVSELLGLVRLDGLGERKPSQLSGGQQQRVALARALSFHPNLVLLDEPLSNLDAKLREQVRLDLRDIQRQTGQTTIFVTHDQDEALVMSDRVVLMNDGVIEQVAAPEHLYVRPETEFAARFLGANNLLPGKLTVGADGSHVVVDGIREPLTGFSLPEQTLCAGAPVWVCIRPESVDFPSDTDVLTLGPRMTATVTDLVFQGASVLVDLNVGGVGALRAEKPAAAISHIRIGASVAVHFSETHLVARE